MVKKLILSLAVTLGLSLAGVASSAYCVPSISGGPGGDITIVRVLLTGSNGTLDNTSANSTNSPTYNDYFSSAFVPVLVSGAQYTVSIQVGPHPYMDHMNVAAWIDLDGDQTFGAGEKIGQTDAMANDSITSFLFTGTDTAARLRVMVFHIQNVFDPCYSGFNAGESEDYDINARYAAPLVGGGKRYVPKVDDCPNGDFSDTQYDSLCEGKSAMNGVLANTGMTVTVTGSVTTTSSTTTTGSNAQPENTTPPTEPEHTHEHTQPTSGMCMDKEEQAAYEFAFENGITTMKSCLEARLGGKLTRADAAKMIVNFAMIVRHIPLPETDAECNFTDMSGKNMETVSYAIAACNMGLMGLKGDGTPATTFNPNGYLDKAQFSTIISRMIYGGKNNSMECRYCNHVNALFIDGTIMRKENLDEVFQRGPAMIMMMRVAKKK